MSGCSRTLKGRNRLAEKDPVAVRRLDHELTVSMTSIPGRHHDPVSAPANFVVQRVPFLDRRVASSVRKSPWPSS